MLKRKGRKRNRRRNKKKNDKQLSEYFRQFTYFTQFKNFWQICLCLKTNNKNTICDYMKIKPDLAGRAKAFFFYPSGLIKK